MKALKVIGTASAALFGVAAWLIAVPIITLIKGE